MDKQFMQIVNATRAYLAKNKTKIVIATPCFGGLLHNGYFQSMIDLSVNFTRLGIPFEVMTIGNESLIQRARNGIVARFMGDTDATHLMFIDADITFSWINIVKLLLSGRELCGGCYPKKCFNWEKIKHHSVKSPNLSDDELMAKSLDYVFNPIYHKDGDNVIIKVENGMAQVKDIGTGFMMIRRSVIDKMIKKFPETKFLNNVAGYGSNCADYFYTLFDCAIDPVSKVYLSEDYLFCKRWLEAGGELWLDIATNLNHTGLLDYKGCLGATIGEVDIMNKDAKVMKEIFEREEAKKQKKELTETEKEAKKEEIRKNIEKAKQEMEERAQKEKEKEKEKKQINENSFESLVDNAKKTISIPYENNHC